MPNAIIPAVSKPIFELILDNKILYPVRLIPFATGWKIAPDVLTRIFAEREGIHRIKMPTFHIQSDGAFNPMLAKEWDVITADLEILTKSLKSKEPSEDEYYKKWREESIGILPAATFVWLHDLVAAFNAAFSAERIQLENERPGDRELNLDPAVPNNLSHLIYEGFEPLLPRLSNAITPSFDESISFRELLEVLNLDVFYGLRSSATNSIVGDFYRAKPSNTTYLGFRRHFASIPCKGDIQRELIYIWCGFLGLPAYQNKSVLELDGDILIRNWQQNFVINLAELKNFLRQNTWPLPSALYPDEDDKTDVRVVREVEGFSHGFYDFSVRLPKLRKDLDELDKIQPESMEAHQNKKNQIHQIERQIDSILTGKQDNSSNDQLQLNNNNQDISEDPTTVRNKRLQTAANDLAGQMKKAKHRHLTKRDISLKLSISDEWNEMTAIRIERLIVKTW
jgi:hypothetical protein